MYRHIIFDLDGTLLDTSKGIFLTANKTASEFSYPECRDISRLSLFVGPPLKTGFELVFDMDENVIPAAVHRYREIYKEEGIKLYEHYPELSCVLSALKRKGFLLSVSTLKNTEAAREMLSAAFPSGLFSSVEGSSVKECETKSALIDRCIRDSQIPHSETLMVGDTEGDEKGARESGVDFLAVEWGFGFRNGYATLSHVESARKLYKFITGEDYDDQKN